MRSSLAEGFINDEDIRRVREASDIVAIIGERSAVKQRGRDFWCCCPLQREDPVVQDRPRASALALLRLRREGAMFRLP